MDDHTTTPRTQADIFAGQIDAALYRSEAGRQLAEAEATIILAMRTLDPSHPAWLILEGYDGSGDNIAALIGRH
jgi:hypothetical protein